MNLHEIKPSVPEDILFLHREWDQERQTPLRYDTTNQTIWWKPWEGQPDWQRFNKINVPGWVQQAKNRGHSPTDGYTPRYPLEVV